MDLSFLDAREQAEVAFNLKYFKEYNHGTNGHIGRVIIAKLILRLEKLENELKLKSNADSYMD